MSETSWVFSGIPSIFGSHGTEAALITSLGWALTGISCLVVIVVGVLLLVAFLRPRPELPHDAVGRANPERATRIIVVGGVAIPAMILVGAFGATLVVQNDLATPPSTPKTTIEVTGHRWWWEVRYDGATDDQTVTTANEIHLPVGEPVRIKLMASDVVHSFWIPQLAGKMETIPGQENSMWVEARDPGVYRGECAEYCGTQHAHMDFVVVAESPAHFQTWLAQQREPARPPTDSVASAGERVFHHASCMACHAVRGTEMLGTLGPDLTHVAGRLTIGAGLLPNSHGAMGGWIANAQALKPGIVMPAMSFDGTDLRAITAYIETLK